ncbi:CapA family protein [Candidatus Roizmanbacteria bacterium]|nr:CapA family protein [Candidatus Roizmanbacteria bacterium]
MKYIYLIGVPLFIIFMVAGFFAYGPFLQPPARSLPGFTEPTPTDTPAFVPQPISLDAIFSSEHDWVATLSAEKITTVIATGDVLMAREVNRISTVKNNFQWAFEKTADLLRSGDIAIINLETPLVDECPTTNTGMIFCGDTRNVDGLMAAGIDVVNIANNHMGNWGQDGVDTTVQVLVDAGLLPVGVRNPVYFESNGKKFAFLGYNDVGKQIGISQVNDGTYEQDIRVAQEQADMVIVSFHWGVEYTHQPTTRQIEIAHRAVDAGADLIIGNHPHWIQPPEVYRDTVIVYSHGNFVFDQMWSQKTREGMVGRYTFYNNDVIDIELVPVIIEDYGQPRLANATETGSILSILKEESALMTVR